MGNNKTASLIPSEFFQKNSIVALEEGSHLVEIPYEPPEYDQEKNYFSLYWSSLVQNEQVLNDIQEVATENHQTLNTIYNLEDFYDNNLLPKMKAFPHQYVARIVASQNNVKGSDSAQKENFNLERA